MKKMNKKGFTLIELLTVIAILAVILLIAAPTILGVLDKARKNTFKNQVMLYAEGIKTQMALTAMGSGYAQLSIVTPTKVEAADADDACTDTSAATCTVVTVAGLNGSVMDSEQLTSGSFYVKNIDGVTHIYAYGVADANYTTTASTEVDVTTIDVASDIAKK